MRTTRAKFYVSGLTLLPGKDAGVQVTLQAVSRGDRNASWAAATPSGSMSMTINNPAAAEMWDEFMRSARATGRQPEVFVDVYPSTDGWPGDGHKFRLPDVPEGHYVADKCGECGMAKDAKLWTWSEADKRSVESDELAHPNG